MCVDVELHSELIDFHIKNFPKVPTVYTMFHYTSSEGLLNIVNRNTLWFTRYDCLNDYSERLYILDVLESVCKKLRDGNEISTEVYDMLIDINIDNNEVLPHIEEEFHYNEFDSEYYVCCFSKDSDSLPMWNYYSKNNRCEGYNIEFKIDIMEYSKCQKFNARMALYEMVYDRNEQEATIKNAILELVSIAKNIEVIKQELIEFLKTHSLSFKNPCFEHEKEIRAVLIIPKDGNETFKVKYRTSNGCVVPYIEYQFEKDYLNGITVGPLVKSGIAQKTIWQLLKQKKYRFDSVKLSEIPVRF